ncbi:uncharacterized protein TRUGW13939_08967 [Talaromyces rugulosus]|uniref:Uncharacterized protein n=1 Tax=Talaromyces rugulosus TaxID=121627 RepID=A0A7H8R7S6_TALRU|nr:uncharacterized protein TRUGW13939_08967 [Talaromyces rugulosus]QKX61811.1 hypothetical protein TRUGW13939_08967 [Talaromyces rugulosus]
MTSGPIVRIAPDTYSIDDPDSVRILYGHGNGFIKSKWYTASGNPYIPDLFTTRDPTLHRNIRKKVASLYATSHLLRMEPIIDDCIDLLVSRFAEVADKRTQINLQHWMQCYAFDVIGYIAVGKRFGFLDKGEDTLGIFPSLHGYLKYCATMGVYSEFHSLIYNIINTVSSGGIGEIVQFSKREIDKRLLIEAQGKSEIDRDMLSEVLQLHEANPQRVTMIDIMSICVTNIGAGSDTTSISLTSVLYHLIRNPLCLEKLRAEIDQHFSTNVSGHIKFADAQKLPYLQACIKESLRVHPATGLPLGRVVPKGGVTVADTFFPEGTTLGVNTWVAHANASVFGPDALSFRPERWLDSSKEELKAMDNYFLAFGQGSRTCIGKNISLVEMTKLIPILVRNFDFRLTGPDILKNGLQCENVWFVKQNNIICDIQHRSTLKHSKGE